MTSPRAVAQIMSIELRNKLSYRADLLIEIGCTLFARAYLSFVVWQAVFQQTGTNTIAGYSQTELLVYFVLAAFIFDLNSINLGFISEDIYRGLLSKYLIMPINYQFYKIISWLGRSLVQFLPLGAALILFLVFGNSQDTSRMTVFSLLVGIFVCLLGNVLNVILYSTVEFLGFWSDKVWSLSIGLHLLVYFAGGIMIPLGALPYSIGEVFRYLPLYLMVGFPTEVILGHVHGLALIRGLLAMLAWFVLLQTLSRAVWRRGLQMYGGVGI
ncbi:MAG: ABC-2 family transporter protein [Oligoflexia bacterium]|nr:ABC-2 family transporter protein [Oligoflexia bacterium]